MKAFTKTIRPGTIRHPDPERTTRIDVFCKIEWDGSKLSITGVEGPDPSGNAAGSSGQIDGGYAHRNPEDDDARTYSPIRPEDFTFAAGWDSETWFDFLDAWNRWHLNDMRAGCKHQRAQGWDKRPIDPDKPTTAYGRHFEGQRSASWNLLGWIRPEEHPDGLLTRPCPECGYRYGTAWLSEDVPEDMLRFLADLPDASRKPAWV